LLTSIQRYYGSLLGYAKQVANIVNENPVNLKLNTDIPKSTEEERKDDDIVVNTMNTSGSIDNTNQNIRSGKLSDAQLPAEDGNNNANPWTTDEAM